MMKETSTEGWGEMCSKKEKGMGDVVTGKSCHRKGGAKNEN